MNHLNCTSMTATEMQGEAENILRYTTDDDVTAFQFNLHEEQVIY